MALTGAARVALMALLPLAASEEACACIVEGSPCAAQVEENMMLQMENSLKSSVHVHVRGSEGSGDLDLEKILLEAQGNGETSSFPAGFDNWNEAFQFFDHNKDETIDVAEVTALLLENALTGAARGPRAAQPKSLSEIKAEIAAVDGDGSGTVSMTEFAIAYLEKAQKVMESEGASATDFQELMGVFQNMSDTSLAAIGTRTGQILAQVGHESRNSSEGVAKLNLAQGQDSSSVGDGGARLRPAQVGEVNGQRSGRAGAAFRSSVIRLDEVEVRSPSRQLVALRHAEKGLAQRKALHNRLVGAGSVAQLHTFGAPATASPGLENSMSDNGCFTGYRAYTEARVPNLFWGYYYKSDPVTWLLQHGVITGWFDHPRMMALRVREYDLERPAKHKCNSLTQTLPMRDNYAWISGSDDSTYQKDIDMQMRNLKSKKMMKLCRIATTPGASESEIGIEVAKSGWKFIGQVTAPSAILEDAWSKLVMLQDASSYRCTLVFEGAKKTLLWLAAAGLSKISFCGFQGVHRGFKKELEKLVSTDAYQKQVKPRLKMCADVTVAGHSLGGGQGELFAACANRAPAPGQDGSLDFSALGWIEDDTAVGVIEAFL